MLYLKTNLPRWERAIRVAMGVIIAAMAYQSPRPRSGVGSESVWE